MTNWLRLALLSSLAILFLPAAGQTKAEDFPMDQYVFGMLRKGPRWSAEKTPESKAIQEGHMAHINKMAASGKLIIAGPLMDDGDIRGLLIFKMKSVEEARALAGDDPAVRSGRLTLELHPWFAGAGLTVTGKK